MIKNKTIQEPLATVLEKTEYQQLFRLIFMGMPQKAIQKINSLLKEAPTSNQNIVLLKLLWLAESYCYNLYPDGNGADGLEISNHWNGQERLKKIIEQKKQLELNNENVEQNYLAFSVIDMLASIQSQRSFIKNASTNNTSFQNQLLKISIDSLNIELRDLKTRNADLAFIELNQLFQADLFLRIGKKEEGRLMLEALKRENVELSKLLILDYLVAPLSSPMVWNTAIQTNMAADNDLPWQTEEKEIFSKPTINLPEFKKSYHTFLHQYKEDKYGRLQIIFRFVYLEFLQKDFEESKKYNSESLQLAKDLNDFFLLQLAQTQKILIDIANGNRSIPIDTITEISNWGKENGSFSFALGLGIFITRIGRQWLLNDGDIEAALTCFTVAQLFFQNLGAETNEAQSYFDKGKIYEMIGDWDSATVNYESGLSCFRKVIDNPKKRIRKDVYRIFMMAACELLNLYIKQMNGDVIARLVNRIDDTQRQEVKNLSAMNENVGMDGLIQMLSSQTVEQGRIYGPLYKALKLEKEGDLHGAEKLYKLAKTQIERSNSGNKNLYFGVYEGHRKNYSKAKTHFINFLNGGESINSKLISIFEVAGEDRYQEEVIKQDQRTLEMAFLFMLRVKDYDDARKYSLKLEEGFGENWWSTQDRPWETLTDYGEMYEGRNEYKMAAKYYDLAIDELEKRRVSLSQDEMKSAIGSGKGIKHLYFFAARNAIKAKKEEDSLKYIELNKAKALVDLAANVNQDNLKNKTGEKSWRALYAKASLVKTLIAQERRKPMPNNQRVVNLTQHLLQIQHQISEKSKDSKIFNNKYLTSSNSNFSLKEICNHLKKETLVIEYFLLGESMLIWLLDKNGIKKTIHFQAEGKENIEYQIRNLIADFYQVCRTPDSEWETISASLSKFLIDPIAKYLSDYKKLIIIPHGAMHKVPFQALVWKEQLLVEKFHISYLPASSLIPLLSKNKRNKTPSILSIGNPKNMLYREEFSNKKAIKQKPLIGAAIEATFVAQQFPDNNLLLLGSDATEKAVVENIADYSIILFATHGVLSENSPMSSSILLANGESLALHELMGLNINADLVVLSACDTALGEIKGGDDVIGLSRGLFAAGAKSSIVSLWQIEDLSTSLMMIDFFKNISLDNSFSKNLNHAQKIIKNLKKKEAKELFENLGNTLENIKIANKLKVVESVRGSSLRKSIQKEKSNYDHPYYWASFQYLGL